MSAGTVSVPALAETAAAGTVGTIMDTVGSGLALLLNGLLRISSELVGWHTLLVIVLLLSLLYVASVEVAELDRSNFKPSVERH